MPEKRKRERIPQTEVLEWLYNNHPELHEGAEIDRAWVCCTLPMRLPVDGRRDERLALTHGLHSDRAVVIA